MNFERLSNQENAEQNLSQEALEEKKSRWNEALTRIEQVKDRLEKVLMKMPKKPSPLFL